ncbi:MAG TPA: DUF58 domain-containing protein [Gemmatimonadaceae bacterium]|nr:DUF58 domain-containing protein [Gemmatimonadaceae bacterium]
MLGQRSEAKGQSEPRPFSSSVEARQRRTLGVSPEVLRQVRLIELRTRGLVNSVFAGEYRSVFKGQGMEFAEVREYQPGDEVRSIDWNVSARTGRTYVKRYVEERELTVMLAVDCSGSESFGTARRFKQDLAAEVAALLTMSAVRNNDRIGVLLFSDRVEHVVPPRKGRRHALRVIRDILVHEPEGRGTDIAGALEYLRGMLTSQHAIVFLLSDLQEEGLERSLKLTSQRHDLVVATIEDPREAELPNVGLARFVDAESGVPIELDTGDARVRAAYKEAALAHRLTRRKMLRRLAIDEIPLRTNAPYVEALLRFFGARERRRGRRGRR